MDRKTRKIMTLNRRLHPRSSVARDERKKTLPEGKFQGRFLEKTRNIARKFSGKWKRNVFLRGHVICSSGAGTKNQFNQSKDRQTTDTAR